MPRLPRHARLLRWLTGTGTGTTCVLPWWCDWWSRARLIEQSHQQHCSSSGLKLNKLIVSFTRQLFNLIDSVISASLPLRSLSLHPNKNLTKWLEKADFRILIFLLKGKFPPKFFATCLAIVVLLYPRLFLSLKKYGLFGHTERKCCCWFLQESPRVQASKDTSFYALWTNWNRFQPS